MDISKMEEKESTTVVTKEDEDQIILLIERLRETIEYLFQMWVTLRVSPDACKDPTFQRIVDQIMNVCIDNGPEKGWNIIRTLCKFDESKYPSHMRIKKIFMEEVADNALILHLHFESAVE